MSDGEKNSLTSALMDRLFLDESRIDAMAVAVEEIAALKEPVGRVLDGWVTEDGLKIEKVSIPIGVIGSNQVLKACPGTAFLSNSRALSHNDSCVIVKLSTGCPQIPRFKFKLYFLFKPKINSLVCPDLMSRFSTVACTS